MAQEQGIIKFVQQFQHGFNLTVAAIFNKFFTQLVCSWWVLFGGGEKYAERDIKQSDTRQKGVWMLNSSIAGITLPRVRGILSIIVNFPGRSTETETNANVCTHQFGCFRKNKLDFKSPPEITAAEYAIIGML